MTGRAVLDNFGNVDVAATFFVESQKLSRGATSGRTMTGVRAEF